MRTKNPGFDHIGSVMETLLGGFSQKLLPGLLSISRAWPDLVEKEVAENSAPADLRGRILIVHATSTVWLQELHFIKEDLIERINRNLGKDILTDIRFKIGPV